MFTKIEREKPEIFHKLHRNLMCYFCLKSVKAIIATKRQKAIVKMLFSPPNNGKPGFIIIPANILVDFRTLFHSDKHKLSD
jgi:hypothetical protein